jgi:hypothetical protein
VKKAKTDAPARLTLGIDLRHVHENGHRLLDGEHGDRVRRQSPDRLAGPPSGLPRGKSPPVASGVTSSSRWTAVPGCARAGTCRRIIRSACSSSAACPKKTQTNMAKTLKRIAELTETPTCAWAVRMLPELMPAAVYVGDGRMTQSRIFRFPFPDPTRSLVEVAQCGICGSDMHLVLEGYARPGTVLGHEWAGTVWPPGTAVSGLGARGPGGVEPHAGCGTCRPCRAGSTRRLPGPGRTGLPVLRGRLLPAMSWSGPSSSCGSRQPVHPGGGPDRTHGHRRAHGQPVPGDTRRPRPHHRRRAGGSPDPGRAAGRRGDRHHRVGTFGHPTGPGHRRRRGHRHRSPTFPVPAPLGRPVDEPFAVAFECSGNARGGRGRSRPAPLRRHPRVRRAPAGTCPGSTTTG